MADIMDAVLPETQGTDEGRLFEKEVDIVLGGERRDHPCYIGGFKIGSGTLFYLCSPIDETIRYGSFQEPEPGTMKAAVDAACRAAAEWSEVPAERRASYFRMYADGLKARRMHYAALVSVTSGMTREDALVEVDSLVEAIGSMVSQAPGLKARGGGVWAVITSHSSPLASPVAYAVGAMIAGNAVVMNPSNLCPLGVFDFYKAVEKLGLPGGVLNLVVDRVEEESTKELANDMRLRGVVASGTGDRMEDMMFLQIDDELRFVNNLKGMSPIVVHRPGDVKAAARAIVESAFAYSGQRVHSCSKVIVTADDQQRLVDAIVEIVKDLRVGDPIYDSTFTGPVIDVKAAARFDSLVMENLPYVIAKAPRCRDSDQANYVSPVVVAGLEEDNELGFMDSGLPILDVKVVGTFDEAMEELADTECGMSAGIFSKDAKAISRFQGEADAPVKFVNRGSRGPSPVVGLDLGAFRRRGRGRSWRGASGPSPARSAPSSRTRGRGEPEP